MIILSERTPSSEAEKLANIRRFQTGVSLLARSLLEAWERQQVENVQRPLPTIVAQEGGYVTKH